MVHEPYIIVSAEMLFFILMITFLTRGVRAHKDEHLELLYAKIAL